MGLVVIGRLKDKICRCFFILFVVLDKKRKSRNFVILSSLIALGLYLTR